ncbi:MAG TPA: SCP2 sterol-binding domain-containing protein [Mesorhizobium sp.]|jgi:putative sterol carrier protein|nr:SCP2 sterol-binding domain-containing protein [Mesorhizobium sp.]
MDINAIADKIRERMAGSGFDRSVLIDLKGEGTILIDGADVSVGGGEADCTIRVAKDDFEEIAAGTLDPTSAFMTGKMSIEGDMGAAMALGRAL